jgi:hypothetical protein
MMDSMWPFRRKPVSRAHHAMRRIVAGLIIGGAIGAILGGRDTKEESDKEKKPGRWPRTPIS